MFQKSSFRCIREPKMYLRHLRKNLEKTISSSAMTLPKVLITNENFANKVQHIFKNKCDMIVCKNDRKSILDNVQGVDAIYWATLQHLNAEILNRAGPQMRIASTPTMGINHIDVAELKKRKIRFSNGSGVSNNAVADMAILLTLAASRRFTEAKSALDKNQTQLEFDWMLGRDLAGSTVGIVGLGGIGQAIVQKLRAFLVTKILYSGRTEKDAGRKLGAEFVPFDFLIENSDFVIVSCPLTCETRYMFDARVFSKMKTTSILVNISRGEVIVQEALIDALKSGKIYGAALDVYTPEPLPPDHELLRLPNVVVTPHIGSATVENRRAQAEYTASNILRGLAGQEMLSSIC